MRSLLLTTVALACLASAAAAWGAYQADIPNGNAAMRNGVAFPGLGHESPNGGDALNPFGEAFAAAGYRWTVALCQEDSDGDGQSNGFELGDPLCVWAKGGDAPQRTDDISHPGFADSTTAAAAPAAMAAPTARESNEEGDANKFKCGSGDAVMPTEQVQYTEEYAEANQCCLTLPCKYEKGCWNGEMLPLYSAPRAQAITKEQALFTEETLLRAKVRNGEVVKTSVASMPNNSWYRIPVPHPKQDPTYEFFYDGIKSAFKRTFNRTLRMPVAVDAFFIDDFTPELWANDETYENDYPGAGYWIHNDCSNFRICHGETGYKAEDLTGNGFAFVLPIVLPSDVDYRDGHAFMPAALELYNISHGYRDPATGKLFKPPNRSWMTAHRYNLGEIIFFNPFRFHSGHVPRTSEFKAEDNKKAARAEVVGFGVELKESGDYVLFRMCKGSTDDSIRKKILATDVNPDSDKGYTEKYFDSDEEVDIHRPLGALKGLSGDEL